MCCPIHQSNQKRLQKFSSSRRVTRRQVMRDFIGNGTDQCQNGSSNILIPYREQPRSTPIVVAYPRLAFSATKRTNHAPISFDQHAQVSQGRTSCRNKETFNTQVHGGGGLELVKPRREPASIRPKPCASLENAPVILPVRRFLLALVGRKQTGRGRRSAFPSETSRFAPLILAHRGSALPWLVDDRASSPSSPNLVLPHPTVQAATRLRVCCNVLPGFPRQCPLPLACHHLPKGTKLAPTRGAHLVNTILNLSQPNRHHVSTDHAG